VCRGVDWRNLPNNSGVSPQGKQQPNHIGYKQENCSYVGIWLHRISIKFITEAGGCLDEKAATTIRMVRIFLRTTCATSQFILRFQSVTINKTERVGNTYSPINLIK